MSAPGVLLAAEVLTALAAVFMVGALAMVLVVLVRERANPDRGPYEWDLLLGGVLARATTVTSVFSAAAWVIYLGTVTS